MGIFSHHDGFMHVCQVRNKDIRTLEVDVFFPWDGRVCLCCSAVAFFCFEGGGEVRWVDCLCGRARNGRNALEDTFEFLQLEMSLGIGVGTFGLPDSDAEIAGSK